MKTSITNIKHNQIILVLLFLMSAFSYAQLKNDLDPRFNEAVNGDFTIIANNMLSVHPTNPYNGVSNNQDFNLVYVDIDGNTGVGNTTFNSSSANFENPNTSISCLNIKEVYLYWAASDFEPDINDPNSENRSDWNYNDIKLMLPSQSTYTDLTADEVIYRGREDHIGAPFNGHFSNDPYVCFKDITSLVSDLVDNNISPFGTYQVANIEATLGNLIEHGLTSPTGATGGWQIVFVYESPLLPLKNISIYDGYAHVLNNDTYDVTISGFQTVPIGNVNAQILMGALEGDRGLTEDRFQIENVAGIFQDLTTAPVAPLRPGDNFFNSRITIDNTDYLNRNPASSNTLGFDAALFELQNTGNLIIGNNQTSATLRLTSASETYGLFLLGLSLDVWEPNLGPIQVLTDIANTPVAPGSTIGGSFNIENKGNDDAVSVTISSTLPPQLTLVEPIVGLDTSKISYTYNSLSGDLVFTVRDGNANAGDPPFDVDFDLEIKDECYFLEENCNLSFGLQFVASYRGVQNTMLQTTDSSSGLDTCGVGNNEETTINIIQPTVSWQTAVASLDRTIQCNNATSLDDAQNLEPVANKCSFSPIKSTGAFVPNPTCPSIGTYTNTWNFVDACGETISDFVQTITVINTTPIVLPPDGVNTVNCIADATETFTLPTVTDACGNTLTPSAAVITENTDPLTCEGTRTYTYTYTDCANNTADWAYVYTIEIPAFTIADANGAEEVECISEATETFTLPTVTDACGNTLTPSAAVITDSPDPLTCEGTRTYTYTYTDCANNSAEWSYVYTIELTPFILPANGIETIDNLADATEPTPPSVNDNCGNPITPSAPTKTDTPDCQGSVVYTFTYTDCAGNSANWTYTYTIELAPFTVPSNEGSTEECIADATAPTPPDVFDANGDAVIPVMTENTDPACEGDKIYTFTYTDCAGNSGVWEYTYTIDTVTAPVVPANDGSTVECIADATQPNTPIVTDVCGNDITPVITENTDPTCEGDKIYTFTYTDCAGNESVYIYTYTIDITTAPVVPANDGSTVECIANATQPATPVVTDVCGNDITPVITENTDPTCEGDKTYTFTYTDCAGNESVYIYTYTIDLTPFILPANGIETIDNLADATEPTPPSVNDNCGNPITPSAPTKTDTPDCQGSVVYTFTYTDCAGNSANWTYTYTIELAPFTVPSNEGSTEECIADATAPTPPDVFDANGDAVIPVMTENTDPACEGDKIYTFTYTDCAGNTGVWEYTYTIDTVTAPVVPANDGSTVECIADATQPPAPVVTDVCGNDITPVITENTDPTCEGDKIYTFTYTDCAGNESVYIYTYTIDITTAPVVPTDDGSTVECIADATQPNTPIVTDVCGNDITPVITENTDPTCEGDKIYTFTYTDCAGNESVYIYTYTIDITTAPVVPANDGSTVECIANATQPATPVVTDVCGNDITPVITENTDPTCEGDKTYTFTYTDCAGNESVYIYTYTIDLTPFILPANGIETIDNLADATEPTPPSVNDNCGNPITPSAPTKTDTPDCQGSVVYTFTYTDCAGNSANWTHTYTIELAPFTVPSNEGSTEECIADATAPTPPDVFDANGDAVIPVMTENTDPTCEGDKIYTFTYTDCAGNTGVWEYTYTIDTVTAPVVPANDGSTVECIADATQPTVPVVTDVCGNDITPVITENTDPACEGDKIYTFTYTDCAGNESVYTYTYTINITTAPVVPTDTGSTVECIADATQPNAPIVTDVCGNDITPVITENTDPTCEGDKIYTFTYTDCAGNESIYTYTYTIDLTPFILPANGLETIDNLADAAEPTPPTVTDNCGNPITPSAPTKTDTPDCQGSVIYTFTYEDCAGNTANWSYTYTIELAPFTVPDNEGTTVECIADATAPTPPVVVDANGKDVIPVMTENDDPICEGDKIYTFTYTDCAGNAGVWEYTYTIDVVSLPVVPTDAGSTVECIADATQPTAPVVTDVCGNDITPVVTDNDDPVCEGDKVYTFTYTDCAGNESVYIYTYTIDVTTAPVLPTNDSSTVECIADATQPNTPVVTDTCGNDITPVITENTDPICEGDKIYTFTYTDCAGNESVYIYTYTIDVTTAPVVPTNTGSTVECVADATQPTTPIVTDVCGNDIIPVITENTDPVCEGDKIYTFTYTDCAGNESVYIYTYTVKDTTAPVLTLPANVTAECSDDLTPVAFGEATAIDNCDANPIVTYTDVTTNGTCGGNFTITRTWTATDACGNAISANQIISTADTTAPDFDQTTLPEDVVVECDSIPAEEVLTATDNCGTAIVTVEDERTDGNCPNNYIIKRSYTATDECGVTNTHIQTITVQDSTPPEFVETLPVNRIVAQCDDVPEPITLTATDVCGSATVSVSDSRTDGSCPNSYTLARTWIATDTCGLTTTYTQIIIVQDTTAPTFVESLPREITVECDDVPEPTTLTAVDNCGTATVGVTDARTDGDCPSNYVIARTWVATDECGLTTSHTQIINVQDTTAPVPTSSFEDTLDVSCTDIPEAPEVNFEDNCSSNVIVEFEETNLFDENVIADYQIIRTWTVRDACNNEEVYTQTLNVSLDEILNEVVAEDRCFDDGVVNLDNFLAEDVFGGTWEIIEGSTVATISGSVFDPTNLEEAYSEEFNPNTEGIQYVLRYTGFQNGCINVTDVIMIIDAKCKVLPCGEKDISISTAITPNGDGFNETFDIEGITLCGFVAEVKIFNRWGALVYETNEYTLGSEREGNAFGPFGKWNGSSPKSSIGNNGRLPNGTYYYIINLRNSGLDPLTGPIYLGTK